MLQHKLAGHWYEYRVAGVREDGDPVIRVTSKPTSGNSKGQSHYTGTHLARAQSSESGLASVFSLNADLELSPLSVTPTELETHIKHVSSDLGRGHALMPADITPLLIALFDSAGTGHFDLADPDTIKVSGVMRAVEFARRSENTTEWLGRLNLFPAAKEAIESWLAKQSDKETAFQRLKTRAQNDGFSFYTEEPATLEGAAYINNYGSGEPYAVIHLPSLLATSQTAEGIEAELFETVSGLTLLSDDQTRILVGNSADDIALHPAEEGSALAKVQEGIHDFRRDMTSVRLANHEGYHNVIALDETSLPAARKIAESVGDKGRALLLDTEHGVLLDDHGRVVVMVEGGALNRLSLVGSKETLDEFSGARLAEQVVLFARDGSVGSVTVQPVLEDGEGFDSASAFADLAVLGADSPWQDKAGYVRLHPLVSDDHGQLIESDSLRVGVPGKPDGMELDNGYLKTALGLAEAKQPGAFEAGLRSRLATIRKEAVGAEADTFRSLTLDYASKVHLLHAEFEVFRAAMDQFYAEHPDQLSPRDMPLLSSLKPLGDGVWQMTFSDNDANPDSYKTLEIDDLRIVDFIHSYSDKIDKVRDVLDIGLGHEEAPDFTEGVEMIDGMGLGMALQSVIEMVGHRKEKLAGGTPLPISYQRALQVHMGR